MLDPIKKDLDEDSIKEDILERIGFVRNNLEQDVKAAFYLGELHQYVWDLIPELKKTEETKC